MTQVSIISVFIAGLISFFSPCVLPLIPAYIGYLIGEENTRQRIIARSLGFVLGFSTIFILMGATASVIGNYLFQNQVLLMRIGGGIIILLGLQIIGIINIPLLSVERRKRMPQSINWFSSILIGMIFAAGWTPCIGPILGTVLIYASQSDKIMEGIFYLSIYSLGIGIPFIISALLINQLNDLISKFEKTSIVIKKISGAIIILFGLLLITNKLHLITNF